MRKRRKPSVSPRFCRSLLYLCALGHFGLIALHLTRLPSEFPPRSRRHVGLGSITSEPIASAEALSRFGSLPHQKHEPFCASWHINVDDWWSHEPLWEIALQNATHQCFRPMASISDDDADRIAFLRHLHELQHHGPCEVQDVYYKKISGSGWGLDIAHAVDGLRYAVEHGVPAHIVAPTNWQYTVGKAPHLREPPCPTADLDCYFLPLTSCQRDPHAVRWTLQQGAVAFTSPWQGFTRPASNAWLLQYATRPQTWLRRRAMELARTTALLDTSEPCLAMHVRRGDVVRHGKFSRRYHRISEYLEAAQRYGWLRQDAATSNQSESILLLTDDANAVAEASAQHPDYRWFHIERPRHRGDTGGWEHHVPSHDPAEEVAALHAAFLLVQHCDVLVHSKSNLADYFYAVMQQRNPATVRLNIDQDKLHSLVHSERNILTAVLSRNDWGK